MPHLSRQSFNHNAKVYQRQCPSCGIQFFTNRPQTLFCSTTCRVHAFQERSVKWQEKLKEHKGRFWGGRVRFTFAEEPVIVRGGWAPLYVTSKGIRYFLLEAFPHQFEASRE